MAKYVLIAILSGILSAFSQILLKKSSEKKRTTIQREYLNLYVLSGYTILAICMLLMVMAYKGLPFKYGTVLESLSYFYIMVLSRIFLNEKLTKRKIAGNMIIIVGVIIYSLEK